MNSALSVRPFILILLLIIPNGTLFSRENIRIACVGDSITYGFGLINREHSYPALLNRELPDNFTVRNFGVNGSCAGENLEDSYATVGWIDEISRWNPDLILFMLGSNDSKQTNWINRDHFIEGYRNILKQISDSETDIVLLAPIPSGRNTFGIRDRIVRNRIYPALRDFSISMGYPLLDFREKLENSFFIYLDNVHPNSRGYKIICDEILSYLDQSGYFKKKTLSPDFPF